MEGIERTRRLRPDSLHTLTVVTKLRKRLVFNMNFGDAPKYLPYAAAVERPELSTVRCLQHAIATEIYNSSHLEPPMKNMPNTKVTNALRKRSDAAAQSFHDYYAEICGHARWHNSLFPALSQPTRHCALVNGFVNMATASEFFTTINDCEAAKNILTQLNYTPTDLYVVEERGDRPFPPARPIETIYRGESLMSHWALDFASVLAACILQVRPGDKVLDLCAAPGGKSLVLAQLLWPSFQPHEGEVVVASGEGSCLHANESDKTRFKRLTSNFKTFLPSKLNADATVKAINIDASNKSAVEALPLRAGHYDKVLLDAPCSSERHIIHAYTKATQSGQISEGMLNWKSSHSKTLAKTQLALLMTAIRAVKVCGRILYATCSISNEENDGVIERMLDATKRDRKKSPTQTWKVSVDNGLENNIETKAMLDKFTEKTKYGRIALPDHVSGHSWGPLYFCLLKKTTSGVAATRIPSTVEYPQAHPEVAAKPE